MKMLKTGFAAAAALMISTAMVAPAAAQVLANDNGGDGYIVYTPGPYFYTLYGSDNSAITGYDDQVLTTFSAVAAADFTQSFKYQYQTFDVDGSTFDKAGYFIGSDFFQLSQDGLPTGSITSGVVTISVAAGQTFGAYVLSTDNQLGRGAISFGNAVPEPATWALMILGFGAVGGAMRRRQVKTAVRFA
jgi:opacity protein-like surface antigen